MTIRLKRLEIHGFKSFPASTEFAFDSGITAVIGPNGSGKSNIADAVRWVLGEQSYSNLRGRRAEDVIFSGSSSRAPLGMAEVSLTLDNADGDLPTPFHEVTVTRRAYRSGENQYLLNGARVRLKDVTEVTASLGQAYTVIGQGLVDAALSQRPEERRGLFEHAAGITGLRLKHAATARHLAETEANSQRLDDLLQEIEPRLRTLERQARQAREYARLRDDLREAYLSLYSALWQESVCRIATIEQAVMQSGQALAEADRAVETARNRQRDAAERAADAREARRSLDATLRERQQEAQAAAHQIDLREQRDASIAQQIGHLDDSALDLETRAAGISGQIADAGRERDANATALERLRRELDERTAALAGTIEQRDRLRSERASLAREHEYLQRQIVEIDAGRRYIDRRRQEIAEQIDTRERSRSGGEDDRSKLEEIVAGHAVTLSELAERERRLDEELATLVQEHEAEDQRRQEAARRLERIDHQIVERSARLEALERLRDSGAGLHAGTRAVLDGAQRGEIDGLVGTLASQISVPEDLETAIEAALGGHLQDLIVRTWRDAERAIAYLKDNQAGRATFQPLDTVRWRAGGSRPRLDQPGVLGVAADLISCADDVEPVVRGLLDRVVIAQDLRATRAVLARLRAGWSVVTLAGEVSRSSGSVTGGARVQHSGALARERDLRELPTEIDALRATREQAAVARVAVENVVARLVERQQHARSERQAVSREIGRLTLERDHAQRRIAEFDERRADTARAVEDLRATLAEIDEQIRSSEMTRASLAEQIDSVTRARDRLADEIDEIEQRIDADDAPRLSAEVERLDERQRALSQRWDDLRAQRQQIEWEQRGIVDRLARLRRDRESNAVEQERMRSERDRVVAAIADVRTRLAPLDEAIQEAEDAVEQARQEIERRQADARERERERDARQYDLRGEENQQALLLERAADALDAPEPVSLLDAHEVTDGFDRSRVEGRIERLRNQLRRIGTFGEEVIAQFEEESERHGFLRKQLDDVQRASISLRRLLAELEHAMSDEFDKTFGLVAQAFESTFRALFGGGQARLIRSYDDSNPGVDIVAQPPGKRLQSLALLSGGERALTAVALLFAILRVNPSPFCLLDEVDAALDESNVVRFREELRDLARQTQFVIVTHNRATIEGADTLYGITMGDDAVSRVISLKLPADALPVTG
jgi:chromosome segregation protein